MPTRSESVSTSSLTDAARAALWGAWEARNARDGRLDLLRKYANGKGGIPEVAEGANAELEDIAKISRLAMGRVVVDTFGRSLAVNGFRSPDQDEDDPAWEWWQAHDLDAYQARVHRRALTYGEGYMVVLPDARLNDPARPTSYSPKNVDADYEREDDPFPVRAHLFRKIARGWSVLVVDETTVTPAEIPFRRSNDGKVVSINRDGMVQTGEPWAHGMTYQGRPVCPVVRFEDAAEDDDDGVIKGVGVVEPIIDLCRAINQANFDRLSVARFGAFDQKLIIGWSDTKERLLRLNASTVAAIDEKPEDVRIDRWQASPLAPYNELIRELREQIALEAAIPLWATGSISNVSTDTVAMIESAHQRALDLKRESFGDAWERVIRLGVVRSGGAEPGAGAEVLWRDTSARTFASVVDGIVKLDSTGVPVAELLDLIPGMTQQRVRTIRQAMETTAIDRLLAALDGVEPLAPSAIPAINHADYDPTAG